MKVDIPSHVQHYLLTPVPLIEEHVIPRRRLLQPHPMGDDEARIDLPPFDPLEQWPHVAVHVALPRRTWHCPVLIVSERFITAPMGNLSISPPYTPITEMVPPLRQFMIASRSAIGRSVSSISACLARS
jgi:hypothetical protein